MIIDTIWGKAEVLYVGPGNTVYVKMLCWTSEQIKKMGGEKEAWILIGEHQILTKIPKNKKETTINKREVF